MERTLILVPNKAYKKLSKLEAGERYMKMASTGYDNLMTFDKSYEPVKEEEDYRGVVRGGPFGEIDLFVFYKQPIVKVGGIESEVVSTSNVMLLGCEKVDNGEICFPYMEAIEVEGGHGDHVQNFVNAISNLYVINNNWRMAISSAPLKRKNVKCLTDRFESIDILDTKKLINLASDGIYFNSKDVSWKT